MPKTVQVLKTEKAIPNWQISVNYIETCNCDYGCPCNFNGYPTFGFCRALVFFNITKGTYNGTKLDGIPVVYAGSWPKAIHQGDGTMQLYIGKEANKEQFKAIAEIFSGKAKGNGPFAIFAGTLKYVLEPKQVEIKYRLNGKNSSFSVKDILDVQLESFKNPITGEEQHTEVHLPGGFIWKAAQACKTKAMRIVSPNISFDDSGQNAFYCDTLTFKGP